MTEAKVIELDIGVQQALWEIKYPRNSALLNSIRGMESCPWKQRWEQSSSHHYSCTKQHKKTILSLNPEISSIASVRSCPRSSSLTGHTQSYPVASRLQPVPFSRLPMLPSRWSWLSRWHHGWDFFFSALSHQWTEEHLLLQLQLLYFLMTAFSFQFFITYLVKKCKWKKVNKSSSRRGFRRRKSCMMFLSVSLCPNHAEPALATLRTLSSLSIFSSKRPFLSLFLPEFIYTSISLPQ